MPGRSGPGMVGMRCNKNETASILESSGMWPERSLLSASRQEKEETMKKSMLVLIVAFAFCPVVTASDIAISTQANWWSQAAADREMQEIVDNVTAVDVQRFTASEQDALAEWVKDHTGDGASDLLILCGQ